MKPPMAPGERELFEGLFAEGDDVTLKNANHKVLGKARSKHSESLREDYKNHYFKTNGLLNLPAILIVVLTTLIAVNGSGEESDPAAIDEARLRQSLPGDWEFQDSTEVIRRGFAAGEPEDQSSSLLHLALVLVFLEMGLARWWGAKR